MTGGTFTRSERTVLLTDPMLATGGSADMAIAALKKRGVKNIIFLCILAAPDGVKRLQEVHPDVDIYAAAYDVKDFRAMQFLDWFVKEQGEEETNANDMVTKMELFGSDPKSLYMLNQELAARVYSAPSLVL